MSIEIPERVRKALDIVRQVCELGDYDSNVIGMVAEIVAEDVFGMTKAPRGRKAIDGAWMRDDQNRTVQVKGWSEARVKKYKNGTFFRLDESSLPDDLLVLLVRKSQMAYDVIYNGPANSIGRHEKKRNTRVVRFDSLRTRTEITEILESLT